jgi:ribonuclease HI
VKTLKFDHDLAQLIVEGKKNSTWRLYDDKDLSVDDHIKLVDKVNPDEPDSWQIIGQGIVNEVIEKRLGDIDPEDMNGHEPFNSQEEMLRTYKQYYGDRVSLDTTVKIVNFDFTPTTGEIPTGAMLLEEAKLYTDGGSRGNPGESACAYAICKMDGTVVEKSGYYIGIATNNQAEYYGFKQGLERCRDLGIDKITLYSDSELVVNQVNGLYKVKNQELAPLYAEVKELVASFGKVNIFHIPRELNKITDSEVNRILDQQARNKHKKPRKHW